MAANECVVSETIDGGIICTPENSCGITPLAQKGYFAIDIERTGNGKNDCTFAVGYAYSKVDVESDVEITCGQLILDVMDVTSFDGLNQNEKISKMREIWSMKEFEMRCFDEFWSKHIDILIQLFGDPDRRIFHQTFGLALDSVMRKAEGQFSSLTIITDTVAFDTVHVDNILTSSECNPLNNSRSGQYQSGIEVDSLAMGALGLPCDASWSEYQDAYDKKIKDIIPIYADHDHQPKNDAKSILLKFLKTQKYLRQKHEKKQKRSPKHARND